MIRCLAKPYEGQDKYLFISYCHKDAALVFPLIQQLSGGGYRVWYDEGIDPGTEWPEIIADHLSGSAGCIAMISENSLKSHNCRREINYALLKKKPFLAVFLEEVTLSPGMELQLSAIQAIFKYTYETPEQFWDKFVSTPMMVPCLGEKPEVKVDCTVETERHTDEEQKHPEPEDIPPKNDKDKDEAPKEEGNDTRRPMLFKVSGEDHICLPQGLFKVGRLASDCNYVLTGNPLISRVHTLFYVENHQAYVMDAGSTNKTRVNGVILNESEKKLLQENDVISVGNEDFIFRLADDSKKSSDSLQKNKIYVCRQISAGKEIRISKPLFKIGKSVTMCDFAVEKNPLVSRVHALLNIREDGLYVKDNQSTNHTSVNGSRITDGQWHKLSDGDELMLADEVFKISAVTESD